MTQAEFIWYHREHIATLYPNQSSPLIVFERESLLERVLDSNEKESIRFGPSPVFGIPLDTKEFRRLHLYQADVCISLYHYLAREKQKPWRITEDNKEAYLRELRVLQIIREE